MAMQFKIRPANVGFCRVLRLEKPDAGRLILAIIALLIASTSRNSFFDVTQTGELLSRLSEATQIIKNAATTNLSEALLLALVIVLDVSVVVCKFRRYLRDLSHKTQAAAAVATSIAEESFGAIRTVRSFAQEEYEVSRYSEKVEETLKLGLKHVVCERRRC